MEKIGFLGASTLLWASVLCGQQLLVFPAVTDEQPGENSSLWVTTATVVKLDPRDEVTIRRKWVCLKGGGFTDDPASAPTWTMPANEPAGRLVFELGGELLEGTDATVGAVALEIEGGEVLAHTNVMDVSWGLYRPDDKLAFGQGQHIAAFRAPIVGPSHIPWVGGCRGRDCDQDPDREWQFLRNNIGIINPNPEPVVVTGTILPFGLYENFQSGSTWSEWVGSSPEIFRKVIPAYGWTQFHWWSRQYYGEIDGWFYPLAGFIISLTPDKDLPYYAYASVVFTPDPDAGATVFNDPMFIPAEPGYIAPITEVCPLP